MTDWTLESLNAARDDASLRAALTQCCAADAWMNAIVASRPYANMEALLVRSDRATLGLDDKGLDAGLAGHPRIGERHSAGWSQKEQSGMSSAPQDVRAQLVAANAAYEEQFGHVYLVSATGKTADELLALCKARLANDAATEHSVVLDELAKINRLRLLKLIGES